MSTLRWSIGADLPREDVEFVAEQVFQHGRGLALAGDAKPLACLVRNGRNVVAGAAGRTEYRRLFVQSLWVHETLRGTGIGSELLRRMERAALTRGCDSAIVETLDERARSLYLRLGYEVVAQLPGYVGPFNRHILLKNLSPGAA